MGRADELLTQACVALPKAAYETGDFDAVEALLGDALGLAAAEGDLGNQAAALDLQGQLRHFRTIDLPRAEWQTVDAGPEQELFEQALAIRRQLGDAADIAESLLHLGWLHHVLRGEPDVAMPLFREALALVEPGGDVHVRSELHRHIGFYVLLEERQPEEALPAGRHRDAIAHSREALDMVRQGRFRGRVVTSAESTWRVVQEAGRQ
jgi:tetratricopeptide (TPR) repeat protein